MANKIGIGFVRIEMKDVKPNRIVASFERTEHGHDKGVAVVE